MLHLGRECSCAGAESLQEPLACGEQVSAVLLKPWVPVRPSTGAVVAQGEQQGPEVMHVSLWSPTRALCSVAHTLTPGGAEAKEMFVYLKNGPQISEPCNKFIFFVGGKFI